MTFQIHVSSKPYLKASKPFKEGRDEVIVTWAVDQLWIDPDTNDQQVLTDYWDEIVNE